MTHVFVAVIGPDSVARVLYVPEDSVNAGVLCRSDYQGECAKVAEDYNAEREERLAAIEAGQRDLFAV